MKKGPKPLLVCKNGHNDWKPHHQNNGRYCRICAIERARKNYRANPDRGRSNHWKSRYNITRERVEQIWLSQEGACAICRVPSEMLKLVIDHDHQCCPGPKSCGKCVRGLLCQSCNIAIGNLKDDVGILANAISYIATRRVSR